MEGKGYAILVVGGTGSGKTTWIKNQLMKIPNKKTIMIYDVNAEYLKADKLPSFKDFSAKLTRVNKSVVVLEEMTVF